MSIASTSDLSGLHLSLWFFFFLISGWGFDKRKGLVLFAFRKWYCICKYCNDSCSGSDKKMYCISYLSSCFINCYFLYSYCKKSSSYLYHDSLFIMWSHILFYRIMTRLLPLPLSVHDSIQALLLQDGAFRCAVVVLPSPIHLMVLLVFVLDGIRT